MNDDSVDDTAGVRLYCTQSPETCWDGYMRIMAAITRTVQS